MPDEMPRRSVRAVTKLEVGLGLAGIVQFSGVIWFAATLNASVGQMKSAVADLTRNMAELQSTAPKTAVLEYRVGQLEQQIITLQATRR